MSGRAGRRPRWAGRVVRAMAVGAALAAGSVPGASAQDVEALAELRGLPVPPAYLAERARDSTAYTLPNGLFRVAPDGTRSVVGVSGTQRMLVVPTLFADTPDPWIEAGDLQRVLFDGPAPRGTLTEAYREFSRGLLTVTGTVLPWVRTGVTLEGAVGASSGLGTENELGAHLMEALETVDATVDFGRYDNDGPDGVPNSGDDDGWVDALAFEFLEVAASCGGPGVWPHRWALAGVARRPFESGDLRAGSDTLFVRANAYIIQSATDCSGARIQDASTIAHEYGHVLGLPDYYHPVDPEAGSFGRRWVLGCWGLMAAGAWGCGVHGEDRGDFGPTHLSARSKYRLDWLAYDVAGEGVDVEHVLRPVQESGRALRIPLDPGGRESLILEYRTREGFDAELPAEGVVVYRQDLMGLLRPDPGSGLPYFLSLVERDADGGLQRTTLEGGDRGVPGDVWGVGEGRRKLHGLTDPGTLRFDGSASGVTVHSIRVEGGVARVRVSRGAVPGLALPDTALTADGVNPLDVTLRVGGGALPYALDARPPAGVAALLEEDELRLTGAVEAAAGTVLELEVEVRDAAGASSGLIRIPLVVGAWEPDPRSLAQPFVGGGAAAPTGAERTHLDFLGNRNGTYDVGDLRAWLRGTTTAPR